MNKEEIKNESNPNNKNLNHNNKLLITVENDHIYYGSIIDQVKMQLPFYIIDSSLKGKIALNSLENFEISIPEDGTLFIHSKNSEGRLYSISHFPYITDVGVSKLYVRTEYFIDLSSCALIIEKAKIIYLKQIIN